MLEYGAEIRGIGALIAAAEDGDLTAVNLLLEMRGDTLDLEEVVEYGGFAHLDDQGTALYQAAAGGHAAVVDALVRKGACIDFKDNHGYNVVDIALIYGYKNLAIRLAQLMSIWNTCSMGCASISPAWRDVSSLST